MHKDFIQSMIQLLDRDLSKLHGEIGLYNNEEDLWKVQSKISNSAGNLALHLCGNLRHFIGSVIGNDGYKRNRENEFAARNIPKDELLAEINRTKQAVHAALQNLHPDKLTENYPIEVFGNPMTTLHFLIHLSGHLTYHLGQINYHRRLLSGNNGSTRK